MQRCFWLTVGITCCSEWVQGKSHFVTIVRGQITESLVGPAVWLNAVALYVPTLHAVRMAFLRQTLSGGWCWNKWFFSLIQVQIFRLTKYIITVFVFFFHWDRGTWTILTETRMVHFPSSPDFFSHCLCDSKCNRLRTHKAFWRYFFLAFILEHHCKRRLT